LALKIGSRGLRVKLERLGRSYGLLLSNRWFSADFT
jgi:hypothetical protein